jgi:hypothetical protein
VMVSAMQAIAAAIANVRTRFHTLGAFAPAIARRRRA